MSSRSRHPGHRLRPARCWAPWASTLDVEVEETPDNVRLNLAGDGADVLLRRKGEALDALQVIVNTAFRRDARGDRHYVVDALGFRKDKDAELRQMARFLMDKAETSGMPQEIGPLNPYARRLVHLAVAEDPDVSLREHRRRVSEDASIISRSSADRQTRARTHAAMFSPDDTIVAVATPPGRGGIGVVRLSGPDAHAHRRPAARPRRAARASARDVRPHRRAGRRSARRDRRSSGRDLVRRAALLHGRGRRRSQRARQPVAAGTDRRACDGGGRTAGGARRVHAARVLERPAGSGAGRGRRRSGRRGDAAAGARRDGSTRRHADRGDRAASTAALFDLAARLEASLDFPDEGFHFITRTEAAAELAPRARRHARAGSAGRAGPGRSAKAAWSRSSGGRTPASRACSTPSSAPPARS